MCVILAFLQGEERGGATSCATPRHAMSRHAMPRHAAVLRLAALALLCCALAHAELEKRAEMSPVPFVMGSRYGRSPERVMAPRNDRFFMGSRYGKRSQPPVAARAPACAPGAPAAAPCARRLLCEYTGVLALFKCVRAHKRTQFARRSADDPGPGEE